MGTLASSPFSHGASNNIPFTNNNIGYHSNSNSGGRNSDGGTSLSGNLTPPNPLYSYQGDFTSMGGSMGGGPNVNDFGSNQIQPIQPLPQGYPQNSHTSRSRSRTMSDGSTGPGTGTTFQGRSPFNSGVGMPVVVLNNTTTSTNSTTTNTNNSNTNMNEMNNSSRGVDSTETSNQSRTR